ncbi:MAG: DUF2203 domain-containing protein [Deltaproteobacteria bacterium]|nr:DUF2203 domain-containing protein [Deltaproteobacteria bacterium]
MRPLSEEISLPVRFFTPKEANDLLPKVAPELLQAAEKVKELRSLFDSIKNEAERTAKTEVVERLREQILEHVERIQAQGVEVKGVDQGLLDFPALFRGERVYLCWQTGETKVSHYHPIASGYAGRKPIESFEAGWEWRN